MLSTEFWVSLGERIREERTRLRMTQGQFAQAAGASVRSVASWEANTARPKASVLAQLASSGIDVGYILNGRRSKVSGNVARILAGNGVAVGANGQLRRADCQEITSTFASTGSPEFEALTVALRELELPLSADAMGRAMAIMDRYEVPAEIMLELISFIALDVQRKSA